MKSVKILCPTGHLSFTPLEKASFLAGCAEGPDYVIADAGSSDMGPRPLEMVTTRVLRLPELIWPPSL